MHVQGYLVLARGSQRRRSAATSRRVAIVSSEQSVSDSQVHDQAEIKHSAKSAVMADSLKELS